MSYLELKTEEEILNFDSSVEELSFEWFDEDDYIEVELEELYGKSQYLQESTPYVISSDKIDDNNGLLISHDGFYFYLNLIEPFKFHRGTLNLDVCMELYNKLLVKEFKDIATVKIESEDEGSYYISNIDFRVKGQDIEGFFDRLLKFEDKYSETLENISKDIEKMIDTLIK